jgi:hypothetical protein
MQQDLTYAVVRMGCDEAMLLLDVVIVMYFVDYIRSFTSSRS